MLTRIVAATIFAASLAPASYAQSAGVGTPSRLPGDRSQTSDQTAATRRDGALMTHANEQKPKEGHSETSAGKSGK